MKTIYLTQQEIPQEIDYYITGEQGIQGPQGEIGPPGPVGFTIQDDGVDLTTRSKLNFSGTGIIVTDDVGNDTTLVTITATDGVNNIDGGMANTTFTVGDITINCGGA